MTLPIGMLLGMGLIGGGIAAGLAGGIVYAIAGMGTIWSAEAGALAGLFGGVGPVVLARPWKPRGFARWPFVMLGVQGLGCVATIGLAVLLYFSAPSGTLDALSLTIASGATFVGSWVGMVRVIGARISAVSKRHTPTVQQDVPPG